MPTDLIFNGMYNANRLGASKYGTFWSAVQPPFPTNLVDAITNPSFERDTSGWSGQGNHSISRITSNANFGIGCLQIVASAIGDSSTNHARVPTVVTTGISYTTIFYAKSVSGNTTLTVRDITNNGSGTFTLTTSWAKYSISITHSTSSNQLSFFLGGAGTFLIDNVSEKTVGTDNTYTLDQSWAERLLENTARVRGMSDFGTIPSSNGVAGTATITFPIGYFIHTPIVDIFPNVKQILNFAVEEWRRSVPGDWYIFQAQKYDNGNYFTANPYGAEYIYVAPNSNGPHVVFHQPYPWILARQIGSLSFKVTNITPRISANSSFLGPVTFGWHAFGV